MKKLLFIVIAIIMLSACTQRGCQKFDRNFQFSERYYHIQQYSGGKQVNEWKFKGIINNEEKSDGYFFIINNTLYEISGDITIISTESCPSWYTNDNYYEFSNPVDSL